MADVKTSGSFADTSITFAAVTDAARVVFADHFGAGSESVGIKKSAGDAFAAVLRGRGLEVEGFNAVNMTHREGLVALNGYR